MRNPRGGNEGRERFPVGEMRDGSDFLADRDGVQASPDELPVIDIHSL